MRKKAAVCISTLVALAALILALYMGYQLLQKFLEYRKIQDDMNEIYRTMEIVTKKDREENGEAEKGQQADSREEALTDEQKLEQYAALAQENPDMVGWISINGTSVAYPVMYTPQNPQFYLRRNFKKEYSSGGMIFIDESCRMDGSDNNLLIYGHHMRNGTMFAQLTNYDSFEYWKSHETVEFSTLDEVGTYQVVCAFKQPASAIDEEFMRMLLAQTEEERAKLLRTIKGLQFYETGVEVMENEKMITLATCEYTYGDGRFFVIAKKVEP